MKLRNPLEEAHIIVEEEKIIIILPSMSILFKSFTIHRTVDLTKKWTDNTKRSETSSSPLPDTCLY